ncbi:MAG: DNA adenine methylase [Anaerolineales bacterium]|nr:DNA adenine methylase [Anaerolineales bacterium]
MMSIIKSPLRYPGGKSRAIPKILEQLPESFLELREPFVGGGSVFIYIRQKFPAVKVWINDLNFDLYCFWKITQANTGELAGRLKKIKNETKNGRGLFDEFRGSLNEHLSDFDRALRFFVLNRITFSGTVDSGGYSELAYHSRFTHSSISRLLPLEPLLQNVKITNLDYRDVIHEPGNNVLVFLDPPYLAATKSRLYGKNGDLHLGFDHVQFAAEMKNCRHNWLITYDDSAAIRQNFSYANLYEWELQYGMNNYKQNNAAKGKELFITNYPSKSV